MLGRMSRDENLVAPSRGIASLPPARRADAARALLPAVDAGILAINLDGRRLDAVLKPGLANLFRLYRRKRAADLRAVAFPRAGTRTWLVAGRRQRPRQLAAPGHVDARGE